MNQIFGISAPDVWFARKIKEGRGIFDRDSFKMCIQNVKDRGTALDIGAHYGTWSVGFAQAGFRKVLSFEPMPDVHEVLKNNAAGHDSIETYMFALGEKRKEVLMDRGEENTGQGHINAAKQPGNVIVVPLDEFQYDDLDLIKMDVEGYEYFVLKGGQKTIMKHKPALCLELNGLSARYNTQDCAIIKMLYEWGYMLAALENKDYLFIHKDKM